MSDAIDRELTTAIHTTYDQLVARQTRLDPDVAAVLYDNFWELCETDTPPTPHPMIGQVVERAQAWLTNQGRNGDLNIDVYVRGDPTDWVVALHSHLPTLRRDDNELCYGDIDSDNPHLSVLVLSLVGKTHVMVPQGQESSSVAFVQT